MEDIRTSKIIKLFPTESDILTLESFIRKNTVAARIYIRAKILLLKYAGYTYEQIAYKLDDFLSAMGSCIRRFIEGGWEAALHNRKWRGGRPEIQNSDIAWVIERACEKPKDHEYATEFWFPASFTRFIHSIA